MHGSKSEADKGVMNTPIQSEPVGKDGEPIPTLPGMAPSSAPTMSSLHEAMDRNS
jgi:hypothetical protein